MIPKEDRVSVLKAMKDAYKKRKQEEDDGEEEDEDHLDKSLALQYAPHPSLIITDAFLWTHPISKIERNFFNVMTLNIGTSVLYMNAAELKTHG